MPLPGFLMIGAAKAATSSLRALLVQHPDVFFANRSSEVQFFARDPLWDKGISWYEAYFDTASNRKALGECSNVYSMREVYPNSAPRIIQILPDARIIYSVRDPLSRIASMWMQMRGQGDPVHHDFARAVRDDRKWLVDPSNYLRQIEPFRAHYGDARILVVFFEDYRRDPMREARRCCEFLGIDPNFSFDMGRSHANPSEGKRGDSRWMTALRRVPGYKALKEILPTRMRKRIKSDVLSETIARPEWTAESKRWALDQIGDDCRAFLRHYDRSPSLWNLDA